MSLLWDCVSSVIPLFILFCEWCFDYNILPFSILCPNPITYLSLHSFTCGLQLCYPGGFILKYFSSTYLYIFKAILSFNSLKNANAIIQTLKSNDWKDSDWVIIAKDHSFPHGFCNVHTTHKAYTEPKYSKQLYGSKNYFYYLQKRNHIPPFQDIWYIIVNYLELRKLINLAVLKLKSTWLLLILKQLLKWFFEAFA